MDYMKIHNAMLSFILLLYSKPSFPRKIVDIIMIFLHGFIQNTFCTSLETSILKIVMEANCTPDVTRKIRHCFQEHGRIFENYLTESSRFNLLKNIGFQEPEEFEIQKTFVEEIRDNNSVFVQKPIFAVRVSLIYSLQKFLEISELAKKIIQNVTKLSENSNVISNVMQANFWKDNFKDCLNHVSKQYLLPLFIYFDDIEVGNPLGSHSGKNKFGVVYASSACLPANIASHLDSIIFSTLIRTEDIKQSSNEAIFKKLIDELNFLQTTGISVVVDNIITVFKFQTILILGDNLALNAISGFVESFKANIFCRICKANSYDCSQLCIEDKKLLRTPENYFSDLLQSNAIETGIKECCIFNYLNNFHITINKSVDFMHDMLEDVCVYVTRNILYEFIFKNEFFTLEYLNLRIKDFFSRTDDSNKPPPITINRTKGKLNMKYSAAEMLYIIRYLGIIIGDKIPDNNEHWKMYILIRKIVDILMSPRIVLEHIQELQILIHDLNCLYLKFYNNLKPKFHFLTHYPSILYFFGPCVHFWSMRYESRHKEVKANAVATTSRQNLLKTIALKQVLKMCQTFNTIKSESYIKFKFNANCKKVYINETVYNIGTFIVISMIEPEIQFGEVIDIKKIVKVIETEKSEGKRQSKESVQFFVNVYEEFFYDEHFMVYVVESKRKIRIVDVDDIPSIPPVVAIKKENNYWIIPRYKL